MAPASCLCARMRRRQWMAPQGLPWVGLGNPMGGGLPGDAIEAPKPPGCGTRRALLPALQLGGSRRGPSGSLASGPGWLSFNSEWGYDSSDSLLPVALALASRPKWRSLVWQFESL